MAEDPIDLIRLEGHGNSVVLRVAGKKEQTRPDADEALVGEFVVDTAFVSGTVRTWLGPEDLTEWQQALDALDAGHDIAWREGLSDPCLLIELDEDNDRCHVTIKDDAMSQARVTVTVPLADDWFDDAYRRLDLVWETWPTSEE